jgi:hypothetical protein
MSPPGQAAKGQCERGTPPAIEHCGKFARRLPPPRENTRHPMIPLDPHDYEILRPPRSGRPWPGLKCLYCNAPARYQETYQARDRGRRKAARGVCEECYQAAIAGRHDGIVYTVRLRQRSGRTGHLRGSARPETGHPEP